MPSTVRLRAAAGRTQTNKLLGEQVIACFDDHLRTAKLLVFLDDNDRLRDIGDYGGVRGFYTPVRNDPHWNTWPDYVLMHVFDKTRESLVDDFVYLFGSTCQIEVELAMTLAHELQHCVQHRESITFWAANTIASQLIERLKPDQLRDLAIDSWCDVPHERDACIVAKRVAGDLFGTATVADYVQSKIESTEDRYQKKNWASIKTMRTEPSFQLVDETLRFFPRLRKYRSQLEECLWEMREDSDFDGIDLDQLLNGAPDDQPL